MDIYVQNCHECNKRTPVASMVPILGKRYCEGCGLELAQLIKSQNRELRMGTIRCKPPVAEKPVDRQRIRNKGKPDVMKAKVPPRKLFP